jgi:biotin synthase
MKDLFNKLSDAVETLKPVSAETAMEILTLPSERVPMVMGFANELKLKTFGATTHLCSIMNARSGACSEDCSFCSQSAHNETTVDVYNMRDDSSIVDEYKKASQNPIDRFGVVTSGEGLDDADIDQFITAIESGTENKTEWCSSLGILTDDQLNRLKNAGLTRFHHNLESAESFFPQICSTHDYSERVDMVRRIKKAGLEICCGGIMGVGESLEQRIELAQTLERENIDAIPLNFHVPVEGTKIAHLGEMPPMEIIKTIMTFRFLNPKAEIKIAAGRVHLRDLQSMIFFAGATGMMIGEYLTVAGRAVKDDLQMLKDLDIPFEQKDH